MRRSRSARRSSTSTFGPLMVPLLLAMPFGPFLAWKRGDLYAAAQRLSVCGSCWPHYDRYRFCGDASRTVAGAVLALPSAFG